VSERGEGAIERVRTLTGGFGAHSVLECVGTEQAIRTSLGIVRAGGAVSHRVMFVKMRVRLARRIDGGTFALIHLAAARWLRKGTLLAKRAVAGPCPVAQIGADQVASDSSHAVGARETIVSVGDRTRSSRFPWLSASDDAEDGGTERNVRSRLPAL
jgi:hypothetical protein